MATRPTDPSAARIVRCPACRGDSVFSPANPWRPFCSERCKG
ncbi:MAG: DNA gyrase inhibitor YacG, partial [Lysobacteraceae bacterium]